METGSSYIRGKRKPLDRALASDLRLLYVAFTRAKARVAIFESSAQKCAPLFQYLLRLGLVQMIETRRDCSVPNI